MASLKGDDHDVEFGRSEGFRQAGGPARRVGGVILPQSALAQACGSSSFEDTYVEPVFTDCDGGGGDGGSGWRGVAFGGGTGTEFDADGNWGAAENTDGDAVFSTLTCAINQVDPGGTVHLLVPGVYREAVSIDQPLTLRAAEGIDVILDGGNDLCSAPSGADYGISISGTITVRLQNLTVRRFVGSPGAGIRLAGGESGLRVEVVNCRIEQNSQGIDNATGGILEVHGSRIVQNEGVGIKQAGGAALLMVSDTLIADNGSSGVSLGNFGSWGVASVADSRIIGNGAVGISAAVNSVSSAGALTVDDTLILNNAQGGISSTVVSSTGLATIAVTGSTIRANAGDGIIATNGTGSRLVVSGCVIDQNAGDGVQLGSAITLDLSRTLLGSNQGFGINNAVGATVNCDPGFNVLAGNVSGRAANGGACPASAPNNNNQ